MTTTPDFHSHHVDRSIALVQQIRAGQREEAAAKLRGDLTIAEAELLICIQGVPAGAEVSDLSPMTFYRRDDLNSPPFVCWGSCQVLFGNTCKVFRGSL